MDSHQDNSDKTWERIQAFELGKYIPLQKALFNAKSFVELFQANLDLYSFITEMAFFGVLKYPFNKTIDIDFNFGRGDYDLEMVVLNILVFLTNVILALLKAFTLGFVAPIALMVVTLSATFLCAIGIGVSEVFRYETEQLGKIREQLLDDAAIEMSATNPNLDPDPNSSSYRSI